MLCYFEMLVFRTSRLAEIRMVGVTIVIVHEPSSFWDVLRINPTVSTVGNLNLLLCVSLNSVKFVRNCRHIKRSHVYYWTLIYYN